MSTEILAPAQHVIGSRYVESVKPYILELTGLYIAVGPNDISTKDIRRDRVFIHVDDSGCVSKLGIS